MNEDVQKENQAIVDAAVAASDQLQASNVPHCLVGKLGLLSHGYDEGGYGMVEFLVDRAAAFMRVGTSKVFVVKAALPIFVGDVKISWGSLEEPWESSVWKDELSKPKKEGDVPVGSLDLILCLMMMAGDDDVVAEAVADGAPAGGALEVLKKWEPDLGARLAAIMREHGR